MKMENASVSAMFTPWRGRRTFATAVSRSTARSMKHWTILGAYKIYNQINYLILLTYNHHPSCVCCTSNDVSLAKWVLNA